MVPAAGPVAVNRWRAEHQGSMRAGRAREQLVGSFYHQVVDSTKQEAQGQREQGLWAGFGRREQVWMPAG
jgi:hypothetical protein